MQKYWYEDPELNELIRSDSCEAFQRCLPLIESEDPTERYRAAYALSQIGRNPFATGTVDPKQIYRAIFRLIECSLAAEDWEAAAAAIVSLSSLLELLPSDKEAYSPMQLVRLCRAITRPLIWQRVLQHLYHHYDYDKAIGDFLNDYLDNENAPFRDIAEAALTRIQEK
jgi:hypothetical protein